MMGPEEHRRLRELLGAYALGQLGADERSEVRAHLAGCPECRAELDSLGPVASALKGLDPDALTGTAPPPPDNVVEDLVRHVRQRRLAAARRSRATLVAAAVAVAAALGGGFAAGGWYADRNDPPVIEVPVRIVSPAVQAQAGLVRHTWGTELKLEATGLIDGGSYTVTFVNEDGDRIPAGTFLGTGAAPVRCQVNAALPIETAREVEVTDADGVVVLDADV